MTRALLAATLALGCAAPRVMGVARVQVCITAEQARYETRRLGKSAAVCVDFEPPPETYAEPE